MQNKWKGKKVTFADFCMAKSANAWTSTSNRASHRNVHFIKNKEGKFDWYYCHNPYASESIDGECYVYLKKCPDYWTFSKSNGWDTIGIWRKNRDNLWKS